MQIYDEIVSTVDWMDNPRDIRSGVDIWVPRRQRYREGWPDSSSDDGWSY